MGRADKIPSNCPGKDSRGTVVSWAHRMNLVTSLSFRFLIYRVSKKKVNGLISTKGSINMSKCGKDVEEFLCVIMNIYRVENIP